MAIQSQPSRISEPFAGSGTKNVIPATNATPSASQAASWASGFPPECSQPISAGGCPVPRNDMNGVLNQISQDYSFRQDGGIWEWSALADYDASRVVRGSNGKIYCSVQQSGPGVAAGAQDPTTDSSGTYWTAIPLDDAAVVHKTGNEDIDGRKTFSEYIVVKNNVPAFIGSDTDFDNTVTNNAFSCDFIGADKNSVNVGYLSIHCDTNGYNSIGLVISKRNSPSTFAYASLRYDPDDSQYFFPDGDSSNKLNLGSSGHKWKQLYATSGTINTSDERLKTNVAPVPDVVLDAWGDVNFVQFKMVDAVAKKGEAGARLHSGLVAQRIDTAFRSFGLDARRYGLFCHDEWGTEPEGGVEAGDQYSLRYEEALCMEAAYQRRRADRAEARLAALEERLATIEAKLNAQP